MVNQTDVGITPMYQLIRAIFKEPDDKTKVTLVYGSRNEDVGDSLFHVTILSNTLIGLAKTRKSY